MPKEKAMNIKIKINHRGQVQWRTTQQQQHQQEKWRRKKNVLLFCSPSSIALPAIRFLYLRWYEKSFVVLWELWYSFWQSYTGMLKKMRAEYISTEWKAAARTFIARSGFVNAEDRSYAVCGRSSRTSINIKINQSILTKKVLRIPIRYPHLHSINSVFAEVKEATGKSSK